MNNQQQQQQHPTSAAATPNYNQTSAFQQNKLYWENAISAYTGNDPLQLWFDYISWYEQNVSHDTDNKIEGILGKCLAMYEYSSNFNQDIRMVKLWLKYIAIRPNALNLFQVLYQRGVGTQYAIFYIGWAHYFEVAGAVKQVESVFDLGFQAKAHPYADLEAARNKFRLAVAQRERYNAEQAVAAAAAAAKKRPATHQDQQAARPSVITAPISPATHQAAKKFRSDEVSAQQQHHHYVQTQQPPPQEQADLNGVIASSLHSVYGTDDTVAYEVQPPNQQQYEPAGIELPSNFATFARNHHEPWTGALCLDEPYEANKPCRYQKHLVYTGAPYEFSPEEIRARRWAPQIAAIKEANLRYEQCKARAKLEQARRLEEERRRAEIEQQLLEQQRLEHVRAQEQERQRIAAEYERQRLAETERQLAIETERQRMAAEEYQRLRDLERKQKLMQQRMQQQQIEQERMRIEQEKQRQLLLQQQQQQQQQQHHHHHHRHYQHNNGYGTSTTSVVNNTTINLTSDDIEEQIEASTIRFSTGNGLASKPKTITIKYRKEKPPPVVATTSSGFELAVPLTPHPQPPPPASTVTPKSRKKSAKLSKKNGSSSTHHNDNNYAIPAKATNNIEEANLLLSIGQVHSSSNDGSTYSYSSGHPAQDSSSTTTTTNNYLQNDDSYSNSEFADPYSAENSNGIGTVTNGGGGGGGGGGSSSSGYLPLNTSTPIRTTAAASGANNYLNRVYSKAASATPNFKILTKRVSNISYQNDDSMCSFSATATADSSFFPTETDDDLRRKRLDKALATIQTHLAKPALDPFNMELCKAFLTKLGFPSREHDDTYKIVSTHIAKLSNAKSALLANIPFLIEKEVGRGSYGSVFRAVNSNTGTTVALKYQKPANMWELYICTEVRKKITNPDVIQGFMNISTAIVAPNASIFVTEFSQFGSLLDINNRIRQATTKVMHESLVMHFSSQILNIVDHLHSCKIIHADIKPDNFLLMKIPNPHSHVPTIRLIDFGCAIDMNCFADNVQFKKRIETDGFTCIEMQEGRPWSYQTDIFCIAGTIHVMLFGEYMQPIKKFAQWDIKIKLPRYLKKHVWSELFNKFLNMKDIDDLPDLLDMKAKIDDELYNMESELQSQIRTLSNILHKR